LKEGLELRWRFWVVNQFEVYGQQFRAVPTTEAKAAAERKAKEEADAKAAADKIIQDARLEAARIIAAAKAAASKKITITCVKGKLTKKVTAVKPKCPAGYKKK
jgi:membrane protein involved in colicin uptake